jgi:hypothetical protein
VNSSIPETVYKYRCWNDSFHRRLLFEQELYLASAVQFNDPFDSTIPFRYRKEDLTPDNIFLKLIEVGKKQWPSMSDTELYQLAYERQSSGDFENGKYWIENYPSWKKDIENMFGIASLTPKNDNLLMWSHYSNSHKGFVMGFQTEMLFDQVQGSLGPVLYSEKVPEMGLFEDMTIGLIRILNTKSTNWQYEEEIRISKIHSSRQTVKLRKDTITSVIMGANLTENEKNQITDFIKKELPHVKLLESTLSLVEFKLDLIPVLI